MIKKIKLYLHYLLASVAEAPKVSRKEPSPEELRLFQVKLSDRTEEKIQAYIEWSKPENIAKRKAEHEAKAKEAYEKALQLSKLAKEQIESGDRFFMLTPVDRLAKVGIKVS